jgi:hypothetical protein
MTKRPDELSSKEAIRERMYRINRGMDRIDRELMHSGFHPDAKNPMGQRGNDGTHHLHRGRNQDSAHHQPRPAPSREHPHRPADRLALAENIQTAYARYCARLSREIGKFIRAE